MVLYLYVKIYYVDFYNSVPFLPGVYIMYNTKVERGGDCWKWPLGKYEKNEGAGEKGYREKGENCNKKIGSNYLKIAYSFSLP